MMLAHLTPELSATLASFPAAPLPCILNLALHVAWPITEQVVRRGCAPIGPIVRVFHRVVSPRKQAYGNKGLPL